MSRPYIEAAKAIVLSTIQRETVPGGDLLIPCEDVPENVEAFQSVLQLPEVQDAARRRGVSLRLDVKSPVNQAKRHILAQISSLGRGTREIVFPCYRRDAGDYRTALESPDVEEALRQEEVTARIQIVDPGTPEIIVATYDQLAQG